MNDLHARQREGGGHVCEGELMAVTQAVTTWKPSREYCPPSHSFLSHLIEMSSLAGALDGYTHQTHSKMHYNNPISEDVDMTASKNDSEAQDDDEEMDDDLFGNDNDVEEQKRLRSVQCSESLFLILFILF